MSGRVCYTYTKSTPDGMATLRLFGQKSKVILKEYLKNTTPYIIILFNYGRFRMSYWIIDLENGDWFACERKWNFILMQLLLNILKSDKNLIFIGQPAFLKIFRNLEKSCSAVLIVVHPSYNPSYICVKPSYTYFNRDTAWHKPFFQANFKSNLSLTDK